MKAENETTICCLSRSTNEGYIRTAVAAFLCQLDPMVDELADIKTAVSEAATNAIVHGYPDRLGKIWVKVQIYPDGWSASALRIKEWAFLMWNRPWSRCTLPHPTGSGRALAFR